MHEVVVHFTNVLFSTTFIPIKLKYSLLLKDLATRHHFTKREGLGRTIQLV